MTPEKQKELFDILNEVSKPRGYGGSMMPVCDIKSFEVYNVVKIFLQDILERLEKLEFSQIRKEK